MVACPCALTCVYPEAKQIPEEEIQHQIRTAFSLRALFRMIRSDSLSARVGETLRRDPRQIRKGGRGRLIPMKGVRFRIYCFA